MGINWGKTIFEQTIRRFPHIKIVRFSEFWQETKSVLNWSFTAERGHMMW